MVIPYTYKNQSNNNSQAISYLDTIDWTKWLHVMVVGNKSQSPAAIAARSYLLLKTWYGTNHDKPAAHLSQQV